MASEPQPVDESGSAQRSPTIEANKALVRRYVAEVVNQRKLWLLPNFVAAEHVMHELIGDHYGPEGVRLAIEDYQSAFPDLCMTIEDLIGEGDCVVRRFTASGTNEGSFMGVPPTGRFVSVTGVAIDRIREGRLVESWLSFDSLGALQQMGALPPIGLSAAHP